MVDVGAIGQEHIGKGALVLVEAVRLDGDFFPKGEGGGGVLAVSLAFLLAVDADEADALCVIVVQDFESVAIEDAHNLTNTDTPDDAGSVQYCGGMGGA